MRRWLLPLLLLGTCAQAASTRAVEGQSAKYPLITAVSNAEVQAFNKVYYVGLGKVNKAQLLTWRKIFQARAEQGDPLAQLLYANTYDLFATGQGTAQDASIAMNWYTRAAAQKYAVAEEFLYNVYQYELLGQPNNPALAAKYLRQAYEHSGGPLRSDLALEMARQVTPDREEAFLPGFAASAKQERTYVEEALKLNPTNTTALDWLYDLYVASHEYIRAFNMADRTDNSAIWRQAGQLAVNGSTDLKPDIPRGLAYYKKAIKAYSASPDNAGEVEVMLYDLYALECEQKITRAAFQDVFQQQAYDHYLQWRQGCRVPPGG